MQHMKCFANIDILLNRISHKLNISIDKASDLLEERKLLHQYRKIGY